MGSILTPMRLAALSLVLAGCALMPAPASAWVVGGHAWPDKTIRYYTAAPGYSGAVTKAARAWNRAHVGVRFARSSRATADVVVRNGFERCGGYSPMGYGGRFVSTTVRLGAGCNRHLIVLTAAHELGHVLGLDHEDSKCARMNWSFATDGSPVGCAHRALSYWLRHPLLPDDIVGAKAIYRDRTPIYGDRERDEPHSWDGV